MLRKKYFFLLLIGLFSLTKNGIAQQVDDGIIQFSGIVVTEDSLRPVSYASVVVKETYRGVSTDFYGYFSFAVHVGDTIVFSAVGYKSSTFVIPNSLTERKYSVMRVLQEDTVNLPEAIIYPWPSKEQFADAFINLNIPDDDLERAKKNLNQEVIFAYAEALPMDGGLNFRNQMALNQQRLYYAGQAPPLTILNPLAWAKFIKEWKSGKYKRKDK